LNSINHAITLFTRSAKDIEVLVTNVNQFTKKDIKQHVRIHPDTFFKLHGFKPTPTYETESTRRFDRGRTETLRTCSLELVVWCRAMTNQQDQFIVMSICFTFNRKTI
jgi:carnitine O-octanoyltransferase